MLTIFTYTLHWLLWAWAGSTWPAVDRHGQQKHSICDTRVPYPMIRSIVKPVFRWFRQVHCIQMPRSGDLTIFMTTTDKTDCSRFIDCRTLTARGWKQGIANTPCYIPGLCIENKVPLGFLWQHQDKSYGFHWKHSEVLWWYLLTTSPFFTSWWALDGQI